MKNNYDLNKLLEFARLHGVSLSVKYELFDDTLTIEVHSEFKNECMKYIAIKDIDAFIEYWHDKVRHENRLSQPCIQVDL